MSAYKQILENSDDKWETSKELGIKGKYGDAMFSAIVSIEELIKSLIVLFNGRGFEFGQVKGMKRFFKSHQVRHFMAYTMFVINVFSEAVVFFVQKLRANPEEGFGFVNAVIDNEDKAHLKMKDYGMRMFESMAKEFEWFSMLETFRQNGMYVDYQDQLKTPIAISQNQYTELHSRLEKVRNVGLGLVETLNSNEELYIKHFESLRKQFIRDNYYDKIESALTQLGTVRDPFVAFRLSFKSPQADKEKRPLTKEQAE